MQSTKVNGGVEWSGEDYAHNSSPQWNWAKKFFVQIPFNPGEKVLDIGCGDGKITAYLAQQYKIEIIGIDVSESQLAYALQTYGNVPNVTFRNESALSLERLAPSTFNRIVSFTCLHWIENHQAVVQGVSKLLQKGGTWNCTFSWHVTPHYLETSEKLKSSDRWKSYFQNFALPRVWAFDEIKKAMLTEEQDYRKAYLNWIQPIDGLKIVKADIVWQDEFFDSEDSFKGYLVQWEPHTQHLPMELRTEFMQDFIRVIAPLLKEQRDGKPIFNFPSAHIQICAEKE